MKKILKEILDLVLDINEEGHYEIFAQLSPHVNELDLSIYKGKWAKRKEHEKLRTYYDREPYEGGSTPEEILERLNEIYRGVKDEAL